MSNNVKLAIINYKASHIFFGLSLLFLSLTGAVTVLSVLLYNNIQTCELLESKIFELTQNELKNAETIRLLSDKLNAIDLSTYAFKEVAITATTNVAPTPYLSNDIQKEIIKYLFYLSMVLLIVFLGYYTTYYIFAGINNSYPFKLFAYIDNYLLETLNKCFGGYKTSIFHDTVTGFYIKIEYISDTKINIFFSRDNTIYMDFPGLINYLKNHSHVPSNISAESISEAISNLPAAKPEVFAALGENLSVLFPPLT